MTDQDFAYIRTFLQERSAIVLEDGKQYLVESRLNPIVQRLQLNSISDLVAKLRARSANGLDTQVVEAMVTTETSFFRDRHPFETLRTVIIPEFIRQRSSERRLNIWCAASSTGQEPYSLALLLREHFPELVGWRISLVATDLSQDVLARARAGTYNQIEVNRGLSAAFLVKYFQQHGTTWQLDESIRRMVEFRELNLAKPWPAMPPVDIIMVRNVMIYFSVDTKKDILARMARMLRPDGYLLLGGAETTFNLSDRFRRVEQLKSGFYQLVG
jgi:chemotaxis protein methyltransferase CheR